MAVPSTVTVAANPRESGVWAVTKRTGYSKTSPRKMPTKTMRKVSPMARNAIPTPTAAATSSTTRMGMRISVRSFSPELTPEL